MDGPWEVGDQDRVLTMCLLGGTGTGKSSTGNAVFGDRSDSLFPVSAGFQSMTRDPMTVIRPWRGYGQPVRCVDLPGLGDSGGPDMDRKHIDSMAEALKNEIKYVHAFLVILNGEVPRWDSHLQAMLVKFKNVLGEEFLRNVMVVITRWDFRVPAKRRRAKEVKKAKETNEELQSTLHHEFDCPCVFIDNRVNYMNDEDLEEEFDDQLGGIRSAFEKEIEKIYSFMRSRERFICRNVEAVLSDRTDKKKWVVAQLPRIEHMDQEKLGRQLIRADTHFTKGWLHWRRSGAPPRKVWGVLRRQQLQFFTDETEAESAGPVEVELLGCICGKNGWRTLCGHCFLIYKPVQDPSNISLAEEFFIRADEKYEFGVDSDKDRRKWMVLVQEATLVSESWSRIKTFNEKLRAATNLEGYIRSVEKVANETMVIPIEWVRNEKRRSDQLAGFAPTKEYAAGLDQANKDLKRDHVSLDGRLLRLPTVEDLITDVVLRILMIVGEDAPEDKYLDDKALLLAKEVALSCSRSEGNGDTLDAVEALFKVDDLVHTVVCQTEIDPVRVRMLRADGTEKVLQEGFLTSTGLPQFEGDASAKGLDIRKVREMSTEGEQDLQVTFMSQDTWVPDWETPQCMKCGVLFRTWVRRHHCRHCGAVICASCSQHFINVVSQDSRLGTARVCFTCYQNAVIGDLNARKVHALASTDSQSPSAVQTVEEFIQDPTPTADERLESCASLADSGGCSWPAVSIEMSSRYRLLSMDMEDLFLLQCRYVRQVRWNGVSDTGRVIISLERKRESK